MPLGENFIHVEIPGLCIGGGDVGVGSSQQVGHLLLMRNTEGAKKLALQALSRTYSCSRYYPAMQEVL
jgi:hypothetical protein